jgi:glycosyltransferase involved in cell wall biosynthesis
VALDLVGPGSSKNQVALKALMRRLDPKGAYLRYHGMLPYAQLNSAYEAADAFVFASSCETFGIILLEAMAGGLPILCSHRSSMPEVVGCAGLYFDPLNVESLADAVARLFDSVNLRHSLSFQSCQRAKEFSWEKCATETFGYVRKTYDEHRSRQTGAI